MPKNLTPLKEDFVEFVDLFNQKPIQDNYWGMKSVGCFWVWYLIKKLKPSLIFESGVWKGQSTWLLEKAAPKAQLISIDPHLQNREYISSSAYYTFIDFNYIHFEPREESVLKLTLPEKYKRKMLSFFDDHINAYDRVLQAHQKGVKYLIFDDNYPHELNSSHLTLQECFNLPRYQSKAEVLKRYIKHYYILPQIIGTWAKTSKGETHHLPCLFKDLKDIDPTLQSTMRIFADDAYSYRWTTYIELR